jgi:hypothetical protein
MRTERALRPVPRSIAEEAGRSDIRGRIKSAITPRLQVLRCAAPRTTPRSQHWYVAVAAPPPLALGCFISQSDKSLAHDTPVSRSALCRAWKQNVPRGYRPAPALGRISGHRTEPYERDPVVCADKLTPFLLGLNAVGPARIIVNFGIRRSRKLLPRVAKDAQKARVPRHDTPISRVTPNRLAEGREPRVCGPRRQRGTSPIG